MQTGYDQIQKGYGAPITCADAANGPIQLNPHLFISTAPPVGSRPSSFLLNCLP